MNLIERAVNRLSTAEPQVPQDDAAAAPALASPPAPQAASTIEAAAARAVPLADAPPPGAAAHRAREAIKIALEPLRARGFVMPDGKPSHIGQEFRVIKRPLIDNAFGKGAAPVRNGKRIMITSSFPGEGKSFCAINLALSIAAERDHKVLLVDADVARASIPRVLGFEPTAGLMDWLIDGNLDVSDLVLDTDVESLAILPAGRQHSQATELLASGSMSRLLDQISERYPDRVVVFDSPPLLVTTESRVLATYMGQIVLVVEAGRTPRAGVVEALATIEGAAEVVTTLLNKAQGTGTGGYGRGYGGYYGYGYGYGYGGYGYGYGQRDTKRAA